MYTYFEGILHTVYLWMTGVWTAWINLSVYFFSINTELALSIPRFCFWKFNQLQIENSYFHWQLGIPTKDGWLKLLRFLTEEVLVVLIELLRVNNILSAFLKIYSNLPAHQSCFKDWWTPNQDYLFHFDLFLLHNKWTIPC